MDTITYKQFKRLFIIAFLSLNFLTFPSRLTQQTGSDGMVCILITGAVAYLAIVCGVKIMLAHPSKSFPEVLKIIFGKWLSKIILFLFVMNFMLFTLYTLRILAELICSYIIPDMPLIMVESVFLLTCMYLLFRRLRTLGNVAQILFGLLAANFVVLSFVCIGPSNPMNLLPLFTSKPLDYLNGTLVMCAYLFSGALTIPFFMPYICDLKQNSGRIFKDMLGMVAMVCGVYCLFYYFCIGVLGKRYCAKYVFPAMSVAQGDGDSSAFFERFELILLINMLCMMFTYITVMLKGIKFAIYDSSLKEKNKAVLLAVSLSLIMAADIFLNTETVGKVVFRFMDASNLTSSHMSLLIFVYVIMLIRGRRAVE
ncbi:MAG: GerAB/ArcD/ProY family transporter [Eubacteriaceae bacterium]|nr:GerAB/ArcD/ProY family transporter [Eubacteriaceae bacterium]